MKKVYGPEQMVLRNPKPDIRPRLLWDVIVREPLFKKIPRQARATPGRKRV